jgi:hypothetical protein
LGLEIEGDIVEEDPKTSTGEGLMRAAEGVGLKAEGAGGRVDGGAESKKSKRSVALEAGAAGVEAAAAAAGT